MLQTAWKFNGTYSIGNEEVSVEDSLPIWYLMDEVGSRIRHDDDPSAAVAPFYFVGNGTCEARNDYVGRVKEIIQSMFRKILNLYLKVLSKKCLS